MQVERNDIFYKFQGDNSYNAFNIIRKTYRAFLSIKFRKQICPTGHFDTLALPCDVLLSLTTSPLLLSSTVFFRVSHGFQIRSKYGWMNRWKKYNNNGITIHGIHWAIVRCLINDCGTLTDLIRSTFTKKLRTCLYVNTVTSHFAMMVFLSAIFKTVWNG